MQTTPFSQQLPGSVHSAPSEGGGRRPAPPRGLGPCAPASPGSGAGPGGGVARWLCFSGARPPTTIRSTSSYYEMCSDARKGAGASACACAETVTNSMFPLQGTQTALPPAVSCPGGLVGGAVVSLSPQRLQGCTLVGGLFSGSLPDLSFGSRFCAWILWDLLSVGSCWPREGQFVIFFPVRAPFISSSRLVSRRGWAVQGGVWQQRPAGPPPPPRSCSRWDGGLSRRQEVCRGSAIGASCRVAEMPFSSPFSECSYLRRSRRW